MLWTWVTCYILPGLPWEAVSLLLSATLGVSSASGCDWCASCRVSSAAPWKLQPAPYHPQTSPLLLSQPVSGWKCILVTFLFWWVLAPKPPTEAGRRHCFPLVWILIKSHLSSSKFKEKSDSVGVVPVHVSPAVSNLCVGHTRRRCAVIFRSSIAWFPACCLPRQHSLVLGDQSSPRAPGHEVSVQCSICQSQMQYCWFTRRAWRGFIENIWVRFAHDETKQSFLDLIVALPALDCCVWGT